MCTPRELTRRWLTGTLIGSVLLIAATGCQASTPSTPGSTMTNRTSETPALPKDEGARKAFVRKMMMDQAVVLLKASGLKYTSAQFTVPYAFDDDKAQSGTVLINFQPCTDQQAQAMTTAIWANGWKKGTISHQVNVLKGPLYLQWGQGKSGCSFRMTTVNVYQHMEMTDDIEIVPELAPFKAHWLIPALLDS
jgi:hypothetical protein